MTVIKHHKLEEKRGEERGWNTYQAAHGSLGRGRPECLHSRYPPALSCNVGAWNLGPRAWGMTDMMT